MRSFVGISLALATAAAAHSSTRKSLSHGPTLPHRKFVTDVPRVSTFMPLKTPKDVALVYLNNILGSQLGSSVVEGQDFVIRDDSYTDDSTGVTHMFVRQLVNGLEVADGDISLNIHEGRVISYGDSFYRGSAPTELFNSEPPKDFHAEACLVESQEGEYAPSGQLPMAGRHTANTNCNTFHTVQKSRHASLTSEASFTDSRRALLNFMIAAHPSPAVAEDIHNSFDKHFENIVVSTTHSLTDGVAPVDTLHNVPGAVNPVPAKLVYVQSPSCHKTKLTLAWKYEVEMEDNWYEAYMDVSHPTHIHTVIDWASDAPTPKPQPESEPKYRVWAWGINDPSEGKRSLVSGPNDKLASPLGWHSIPSDKDPSSRASLKDTIVNSTTTWGNNVFSHENWEGANKWIENYRPSAEDLSFDYKYGPKGKDGESVVPKDYADLAITQLFYTSNMFHDLLYRYGFDEKAGNFQQHNFGRGGKDGDAVITNAQDGSGYNNANFMTPPDGQNGRCRMYVWNTATPYRDGDLEAGIVIHELSHGLSTRLTGGPANSGCLGWGESGGMGEGWGDFIATSVRSTSQYSDYPMGAWAANTEKGIRNYPYSTNTTVNPSTYKTLDKPGYWGVHAIGEVWAELLFVVEQKLIAKHGYSDTLFPPVVAEDGTIPEGDFYRKRETSELPLVPVHGNTLMLKLVVDGMKLQPCRPNFFDARDAILQADLLLTGGENSCELWQGFSERGLGPDAKIVGSTPWGGGVRTDDTKLPVGVCAKSPKKKAVA